MRLEALTVPKITCPELPSATRARGRLRRAAGGLRVSGTRNSLADLGRHARHCTRLQTTPSRYKLIMTASRRAGAGVLRAGMPGRRQHFHVRCEPPLPCTCMHLIPSPGARNPPRTPPSWAICSRHSPRLSFPGVPHRLMTVRGRFDALRRDPRHRAGRSATPVDSERVLPVSGRVQGVYHHIGRTL